MEKLKTNENLNMENSIIFLGNRDDVYRLYQAMDVFALPSRYEGLPVVGVEAQANGLPCVLSDKMTAETKMTDRAIFLSIDESAEIWARKINSFDGCERIDTSDELTEYGFNIDVQGRELTNYYRNVINGMAERIKEA